MFDIRIICDKSETERITQALSGAFTLGYIRSTATRDGQRVRLYATADHTTDTNAWPTPDEAYASAPSILREIGWIGGTAADKPLGTCLDREFFLRKAAVLDRIALADEHDGFRGDAPDIALEAARRLMGLDNGPIVICDPRAYVRQQYARWAKNQ
ncbi:hypothetical protein AB0M28_33745 [Streptomyces sp. NPDC051940]|uniref:hypothetical protein n=1 Tax=Streptomyces sp. NPDC051940 TaxID=3155675 RepID=UPI0034248220